MSKVTDRLENKQIIELAKKQYETKQRSNKFPGHIVKLPSAGKVYSKQNPLSEGVVELKHMTAYEEDIITNSSYLKEGVIFDKLLESLILTPNVNVRDLVNGDYQSLIVSARILGYGVEYETTIFNPTSSKMENVVIDLSKFNFKTFDLPSDDNGNFTYKLSSGDEVLFKFLNVHEGSNLNENKLASGFLEKSIVAINGNHDKEYIQEYLSMNMRAIDSTKFRKYVVSNTPGLDLNIQVEGEDGGAFEYMFPFDASIFIF